MLEVRKIGFSIALIFSIYVDFWDLLFFFKFTTVSLVLLLLSSITSLLSTLNAFKAKFNHLIIFNKEINSLAILLKL